MSLRALDDDVVSDPPSRHGRILSYDRHVVKRLFVVLLFVVAACRDNSRFSSRGDRFQGPVVTGSFVRAGFAENVQMCITLDTDHLQDAPGTISTSDGRLKSVAMRPIPQIWHDPLSTLSFGAGRTQNLVYAASASDAQDLMVVVSLMQSDNVEVRLLRGAPEADGGPGSSVFGVFNLEKQTGPCAF
jgi:hypothetical protein